MGFLVESTLEAYTQKEAIEHQSQLKQQIVKQIVKLLKLYKDIVLSPSESLKFGVEFEAHSIKKINSEKFGCIYSANINVSHLYNDPKYDMLITPEAGSWMLEFLPKEPFTSYSSPSEVFDFFSKVHNSFSGDDAETLILSCTGFPKYATPYLNREVGDPFYDNPKLMAENNKNLGSKYISDLLANRSFQRYDLITEYLRSRGDLQSAQLALFKDKNTDFESPLPGETKVGLISCDSHMFSACCAVLHVTLSSPTLKDASWLHDQLHVFSPIFLALTASSCLVKDKLAAKDTRWGSNGTTSDDRTPEEKLKGLKPRYTSSTLFVSSDPRNLKEYNDFPRCINLEAYEFFKKEAHKEGIEIPEQLINHFSGMLAKDIPIVFKHYLEDLEAEPTDTTLYELIQGTTWTDVRLKPPPSFDSTLGWRVEFRISELELKYQHNVRITHAVQIIARAVQDSRLNFLIPISLIEENFKRADNNDAVLNEKFFWRTNPLDKGPADVKELSILEIVEGVEGTNYVGLSKLITNFLEEREKEGDTRVVQELDIKELEKTFDFLKRRSSGEEPTVAKIVRDFIRSHETYKFDSIASEECLNDLMSYLYGIQIQALSKCDL